MSLLKYLEINKRQFGIIFVCIGFLVFNYVRYGDNTDLQDPNYKHCTNCLADHNTISKNNKMVVNSKLDPQNVISKSENMVEVTTKLDEKNIERLKQFESRFHIEKFCHNASSLRIPYFRERNEMNTKTHVNIVTHANNVCVNDTNIVIFIMSVHKNVKQRMRMRRELEPYITHQIQRRNSSTPKDTSHANSELNFSVLFAFGIDQDPKQNEIIKNESVHFGDILQGDFTEAYHNLTFKSLMTFKWASDHCPSLKYLVKVDDDVSVTMSKVKDILTKRKLKHSMAGACAGSSTPYRKNGKPTWLVSCDEYPYNKYPPYLLGMSYVVTADALRDLTETAKFVPTIRIDDVFITGILRTIANVAVSCVGLFASGHATS